MGVHITWLSLVVFVYYYFFVKKATLDVYVILFIYSISAFASLLITPSMLGFKSFSRYDSFYFIIYSVLIIYTLRPLLYVRYRFQRPDLSSISLTRKIRLLVVLAGFAGLFSVFYQLPYAVRSVALGALEVRTNLNLQKFSALPESPVTTLAVGISSFYTYYILLFFICVKERASLIVTGMMLIGSISYVVSSFCFTARDGIITFILTYVFVFFLFKDVLARKVVKRLYVVGVLICIALGLLLFQFTFDRFGQENRYTHKDDRLLVGTIGYIGMQPYVFAENLEIREEYYGLSLRFPLLAQVLGSYEEIKRTKEYEWMFGTYLTDFYSIGGYFSLLLLVFLFVYFVIRQIRRSKFRPISFLIIYLFYFQFVIQGVFYFRLGNVAGNLYVILVIIFYYVSRSLFPKRYFLVKTNLNIP